MRSDTLYQLIAGCRSGSRRFGNTIRIVAVDIPLVPELAQGRPTGSDGAENNRRTLGASYFRAEGVANSSHRILSDPSI